MYTDELADALRKEVGKKWRPSNGLEGQMFMSKYCENCIHDKDEDNPCEIIGRSMCFDIDDKEYPIEWQIGTDGQPFCTRFLSVDS